MTQRERPGPPDVAKFATEALYVAVGAAVITFQKLQVKRREVSEQLGPLTLPNLAKHLESIRLPGRHE